MEALSMRRLGATLGVDPMAIYYHLPGKRALIRRVVESVFATMSVPEDGGTWQDRVRAWGAAYRQLALAHPNLVLQIVTDPAAILVAAVQANEALYAALEAAGLPPEAVVGAADLVVDYVNGFALAQASAPAAGTESMRSLVAELQRRPAEAFPVQRRVLGEHPDVEGRDSFRFGLDVIIAGIEGLRSRSTAGRQ
jgi:TetR/AcrR family transcriptional regulator, tetracycline repressor protein